MFTTISSNARVLPASVDTLRGRKFSPELSHLLADGYQGWLQGSPIFDARRSKDVKDTVPAIKLLTVWERKMIKLEILLATSNRKIS